MTREQAIAELVNLRKIQYLYGYRHILGEILSALREPAAEVPAEKSLPDCEGPWWEWVESQACWFPNPFRVSMIVTGPAYWASGCYHDCRPGRWVKAIPPNAPREGK